MAESLGKQFLSSLVYHGSARDLLDCGNIEHLFTEGEREVFDYIIDHVKKHGVIPKPGTIEKHTMDEVEPGDMEPPSYYLDHLKKRYTDRVLREALPKASDLLKVGVKDTEAAFEIVREVVLHLEQLSYGNALSDFRFAGDELIATYVAEQKGKKQGVRLGWPTVDNEGKGFHGGDTISIVGRPGMGKTYFMLYSALCAWEQNVPVLFVSMEMSRYLVMERLAAISAEVPIGKIRACELENFVFPKGSKQSSLAKYKAKLEANKKMQEGLWVVDGNLTATVDDVYALAKQLKPGIIYVDGAYLLRSPAKTSKDDRYTRAADNMEALKSRVAAGLNVPLVSSWQFARGVEKLKKDQKAGLGDIGYTDAVGQISSVVLGLLQPNDIEAQSERVIQVMKGRSGETGQFSVRWDFIGMDYSEIEQGGGFNGFYE